MMKELHYVNLSFRREVECEHKLIKLVLCRSVHGFYSNFFFLNCMNDPVIS